MSDYPGLLEQHAAKLRSSAVDPEVAAERGYFSADSREQLERHGFTRGQRRVPALLIPVYGVNGDVVLHQARPDVARTNGRGPVKYETVGGARMALDVHPRTREILGDPSVPLVITEGVLKADSVLSHGGHAIGLLGVWNWRGTNEKGGKVALAAWEQVALNGRLVRLAFDSDVMRKRQVHQALERLKAFLESRGASVRVCCLDDDGNGKVGIDDYLAAGGSLHELLDGAEPGLRPLPPDDPDTRTPAQDPAPEAGSGVREANRTPPGQTPLLAQEPGILDRFAAEARRAGLAGEERLAKILYLSLTSRLLPWGKPGERPVSVLARGTSATGKSYTFQVCLRFFPAEAWLDLGSMSRRYLFYAEEPLQHRMMLVPEWATVKNDEELVALLRILLSEGRVVHGTVEGEGKRHAVRIEKEGPTGLLMTTTDPAVDSEMETRLFAVTTDDTPEQTRRIFTTLATLEEWVEPVDYEPWRELQRWLADEGEHRAVLPFVRALAELMPTDSTRLRRDFPALLSLVRAHALLHQAQRDRDEHGRVVALLEDYAVVRDLVSEIIGEGVEASVTDATTETVEAAAALLDQTADAFVLPKAVIDRLGVGKSAGYDRLRRALKAGYLVNTAAKDERGMKLIVGSPLPATGADFLPSPAEVFRVTSGWAPGLANAESMRDPSGLSECPGCPDDLNPHIEDDLEWH